MKHLILIFLTILLNRSAGWSQALDSVRYVSKNKVSFVTIFDKTNEESKDGFYVNGYVVNIDRKLGEKLHKKKIKITGMVTIVKGLRHDKPDAELRQGRYEDTKHILKPVIEIVN